MALDPNRCKPLRKEEPSNDLYERALSYRYFHPRADAQASLEAIGGSRAHSNYWKG